MSSISLTLGLRGRLLSGTQVTLQGTLFGNNEPGFTFEPWDISTLYQDRVGTTPVTAAGQSVGLRLDKSKGLVLGPELVTNGDFATDTGWTLGGNWSISGGTLNGAAATSYSYIQAIGLNPSKTYRLLVSVTVSIGSVAINLGGINEVAFTSSGQKTATLLLDPSAIPFVYVSGSNFTGTIDNISVRELAGNHEVAISDAKRGVYGWMPKTGRRNLLTYTEQFDNAAWGKRSATATAGEITASAGAGDHDVAQVVASLTGNLTFSIKLKAGTSNFAWVTLSPTFGLANYATAVVNLSTGAVTKTQSLGTVSIVSSAASAVDANGFYRLTLSVSSSSTGMTALVGISNSAIPTISSYGSVDFTASGTETISAKEAQLEVGSTATAYQRVASQYDITEAGVPTCYYVQADGVDDAYVTPTITPGTDKVQVFAGVRKLSETGVGTFVEFSTAGDGNNGAFYLRAPWEGVGSYDWNSQGTLNSRVGSSGQTAPITNVITGLGDISGDTATLRVNGVQVAQSTADQGTGNYLAYPAYIYARGGTSFPFNGLDFGHAVRFGSNLDAATIARVESLIARNTPEVTL